MNHIPEDDYNEAEMFGGAVPPPIPQAHVAQQPQRVGHMGTPPHLQAPQNFQMPPQPPAQPGNPLAKYFRIPGLHLTLPTKGAFFKPGQYEPTVNGEVPVFPMKASDELLMKNPDALMSGYALEQLILSCVPAIKNPQDVSTPDLDALLLAIRAATYGENMEVRLPCPECEHENGFDIHLPSVMSKMTYIEPVNDVRLTDDVIVYVRPYTLSTATRLAIATFEETRKLQAMDGIEDINEITAMRNESFKRMTALNNEAISDSVIAVVVPEGKVTDRRAIIEFIQNCEAGWTREIEKKLLEINQLGVDKSLQLKCDKCGHEWEDSIEFNPSSFFE